MTVRMGITSDGKIKISTGPDKVRLEDLGKWLGRNRDAVLVKLEGKPVDFTKYRVGHLCRIEESDDGQKYNVFIGNHLIGQLPDEAVAFAEQVDSSPEYLISIVGQIEYGASPENDEIFIYIAE